MTIVLTITCDYCNPERSTAHVYDEEGKAWARGMGLQGTPLGWWSVPGKGADGGVGHACPACMMKPDGEVYRDVTRRRQEETERLSGVKVTQ